jgi:hypothetical protein
MPLPVADANGHQAQGSGCSVISETPTGKTMSNERLELSTFALQNIGGSLLVTRSTTEPSGP